jgi:hypothetical protein
MLMVMWGFETADAVRFSIHHQTIYPIVAKVGGLQSQGGKGVAVVNLLQTLSNAGSGVLRLLQQ